MMSLRKPTWFAALFLMLFVVSAPSTGRADTDPFGGPLGEAIRSAHFGEPLVKTVSTSTEEDQALLQALADYAARQSPDDKSRLIDYLTRYPQSGWAPSLWTNLGLAYRHEGYFTRALDAWQKAWKGGKDATDPHAKALIDRAVGELAQLYAAFGRNDELTQLFAEIGKRPITGSATEAVQNARELLVESKRDPRHLFICGPLALRTLLLTEGRKPQELDFLEFYRAGPDGTSLTEVGQLADKAKFPHRLVLRKPGQPVPVPSVVHLKAGHFAAIVAESDGRYQIHDPAFVHQDFWMTRAALDAEASGYFLVPSRLAKTADWHEARVKDASKVRGKGPTAETPPGIPGPQDPDTNPDRPRCPVGMCTYNIGLSTVSLNMSDTPIGYSPPIGPSAKVKITYNQREDSQPAVFGFFNISPKWTLNWLSYVTDDPAHPGVTVSRYIAGGGAYYYSGYQSGSGQFAAQTNDGSILILASQTPATYRRLMGDGSVEIYAQSDGAPSYPRHIFLSQVIDPQGNALTLNYDSFRRLTSLTDATGRKTNFIYALPSQPFLITGIIDPFGRTATLTYDTAGRLTSITDIIGLKSSFTYDAYSLVNSLTTPYGSTTFAYTAPGTGGPPRFVQATDPLGNNERVEWVEPAPIPNSDPSGTVPVGMPNAPSNSYLVYRNSFHWDKNAYVAAGCSPSGGCDYTKARITHFAHVAGNTNQKSNAIESTKNPLENRVWFNLPGQTSAIFSGTNVKPTVTARVLDDGTTQMTSVSYDTAGFFKMTQTTDAVGRTTSFSYPNHIDLATVTQKTAGGVQQTIAQFTYNSKHRPLTVTDAAGQTTHFTYNGAGQVTSITNPLNQTTGFQYNATGDLTTVINANNVTAASFTYDASARIRTYTDSEGWTAAFNYDEADRITRVSYPDGTSQIYTYDKLDLASYQDRQFRKWVYAHDADRRLTAITDPAGKQTLFDYTSGGQVAHLTDPKGNVTSWAHDLQGRVTQKTYADSSAVTYTYENTTSRLKSVLDALGQTKQYAYTADDLPSSITYLNAVNTTPNVAVSYDPYFKRLASMTDGTGTTTYAYGPVGSLGALQLQQENGPLANGAIGYVYDALGRLASRTVAGAGAETFGYDALGRLTSHASDLGAFTQSYLGQTDQITQRQLANSTLATAWSYLPNSGDRRLAGIANTGLTAGQFSTFDFTTTPESQISGVSENSDAAAVYPGSVTQTATHNNLNQITNLSGEALSSDANGNLLSDGQRNYSWDAENRLVSIAYPGQSGKATAFAYDGMSRRTAITSTPQGGSATTTSYMWCGDKICQARDASNDPVRSYYEEGEFVPGSSVQPYYYGTDQIGSTRRVFASAVNAPAYGYDPYGRALQATAPLTDFNYAGMFYNADSGLYLTQYRAYDPIVGRWLSRDPIGELALISLPYFRRPSGDANLYPYVGGNPLMYTDPRGEWATIVVGAIAGAAFDLFYQLGRQCMRGPVNWWEVISAGAGGALAGTGLGSGLFGAAATRAPTFMVAWEGVWLTYLSGGSGTIFGLAHNFPCGCSQ